MFTSHGERIAAPVFGRAAPVTALTADLLAPLPLRARLAQLDWTPDLARDIGSPGWLRGAATLLGLAGIALSFWPGFMPLAAAPVTRLDRADHDELRSQMIAPLALGADSGRRMAPTAMVRPLAGAPERPAIALSVSLSQADGLPGTLRRAGVGAADAARAMALIGGAVDIGSIAPGTTIDIILGRQIAPGGARPLASLGLRARFDLALAVTRGGEGRPLALTRSPIQVDETPLRIRGTVGASLYRSARASGAPASAVQAYLAVLGQQVDLEEGLLPTDTFDIVVQQRRAATGERQAGKLLYVGIDRGDRPRVQMLSWGGEFYEASGVGEQRSGLFAPVPGRLTSHFGQRRHPVLGYVRMHAGIDFKAAQGTPIVAVTDGRVIGAGRMGGCGNAVRIDHGAAMQTRYCHMSQIAAGTGQFVRRGQVIGYVGSTGLSTGPHLHYEMYRNGRVVNPAEVTFVTRAQLVGSDLARFRETLAAVKAVTPGAALGNLAPDPRDSTPAPARREIDRIGTARPAA